MIQRNTSSIPSTHTSLPTDEKELVERFQDGEHEVFNELVNRYHGKIYNLVYKYVHNSETAKDLSQEIFIKAYRALPNFKRQSAFYSWLYRIAINLCIDFIRQQKRGQTLSFEDLPTGSNDEVTLNDVNPLPPDQIETKELGQIIGQAVQQLPPKQQHVFNLRYHDGLQLKEIAAQLDRSEGTIKAHLHHAHKRLRTLLIPYLKNEKLEWALNS
ncbi:sigma-70 family RNA polymerase sigma factor [Candidatus Poribacteria bacterium]|nr:sigma-70 family RNA polymerase sigma factor [Candidatus Poribacteria bacterium]